MSTIVAVGSLPDTRRERGQGRNALLTIRTVRPADFVRRSCGRFENGIDGEGRNWQKATKHRQNESRCSGEKNGTHRAPRGGANWLRHTDPPRAINHAADGMAPKTNRCRLPQAGMRELTECVCANKYIIRRKLLEKSKAKTLLSLGKS